MPHDQERDAGEEDGVVRRQHSFGKKRGVVLHERKAAKKSWTMSIVQVSVASKAESRRASPMDVQSLHLM